MLNGVVVKAISLRQLASESGEESLLVLGRKTCLAKQSANRLTCLHQ